MDIGLICFPWSGKDQTILCRLWDLLPYMEDKIYGETQRTGNSQQPQLSAADGSDWTDLRRDANITQTGFEHLFSDRWDRETGFEER